MLIGRWIDISAKPQIISLPYKSIIPTSSTAVSIGQSCHEEIDWGKWQEEKEKKDRNPRLTVLNLGGTECKASWESNKSFGHFP